MSDIQPTFMEKCGRILNWLASSNTSKDCKCRLTVAEHVLAQIQQQLLDERIRQLTSHSVEYAGYRDMTSTDRLSDVRRLVDSKNANNDASTYAQGIKALRAYRQIPFRAVVEIKTHHGAIEAVLRIVYEIGFAPWDEFFRELDLSDTTVVGQQKQQTINEVGCANILLQVARTNQDLNATNIIRAVNAIKDRFINRILHEMDSEQSGHPGSYGRERLEHRQIATPSSSGVFTTSPIVSPPASSRDISARAPSHVASDNIDSVSAVRESDRQSENILAREMLETLKSIEQKLTTQHPRQCQERRLDTTLAHGNMQIDIAGSTCERNQPISATSYRATIEAQQETGDSEHFHNRIPHRCNLSTDNDSRFQLTTKQLEDREDTARKEPLCFRNTTVQPDTNRWHLPREDLATARPSSHSRATQEEPEESRARPVCQKHCAVCNNVHSTQTAMESVEARRHQARQELCIPEVRETPQISLQEHGTTIPGINTQATGAEREGARSNLASSRDTVQASLSHSSSQNVKRFPTLDDLDNRRLGGVSVQERAKHFMKKP